MSNYNEDNNLINAKFVYVLISFYIITIVKIIIIIK
jgi:hypothetical protein